jgi:hypothetical protein
VAGDDWPLRQASGGIGAGGAVGASLGGLAALAGVIVLVFLLKKKKKVQHEEEVEMGEGECEDETNDGETATYVSEYGLSDDGPIPDLENQHEDVLDGPPAEPCHDSDFEHVSEHNPEDFEDAVVEPEDTD